MFVNLSRISAALCLMAPLLITGCDYSNSGYPTAYSAAPLNAKIVDSGTGQPVEGAIVVAVYVMEGLDGRLYTPLHYEETLTDENGEFTFDGFDKKPIPRDLGVDKWTPLGNRDPRLYAFAEGYKPAMYQRKYIFSREWKTNHRVSPLDGNTFSIKPQSTEINSKQHKQLTSSILRLSSDINSRTNPGTGKHITCAFNKIPLALTYLNNQLTTHNDALNTRFILPQAMECYSEGAENEE